MVCAFRNIVCKNFPINFPIWRLFLTKSTCNICIQLDRSPIVSRTRLTLVNVSRGTRSRHSLTFRVDATCRSRGGNCITIALWCCGETLSDYRHGTDRYSRYLGQDIEIKILLCRSIANNKSCFVTAVFSQHFQLRFSACSIVLSMNVCDWWSASLMFINDTSPRRTR